MHPIIRLVNRNLTISINPGFLIWQVIFPLIYIFVAGFAYTSLIDQVPFGDKNIDYPTFLATGMIGFNIMNSTLISGIIIWNDRRHGMFEQIMSGPFTRTDYILSNICTIGIVGLASASLIALVGYPVFFDSIEFTIITIPMIVFAAIVGSVLFGSIASIISTRLRSSEGFNVIINTVFLFLAFVSTAFYPASGSPEPLRTAFYLNPLTYLVDVIRAGIFGNITEFVIMEMGILVAAASVLFIIAAKLLTKLDF
ncbi:ABC transporter permease [Candidatus Nitrosarchaeum limnium]|jgi:ABC-2 type transport system permease protein|uniref:ABC-2 type transporter n=1 Tax=Candidatus Nitrosarchaeum limnium BG20 TaxID=859192 RepID=S2E584_9ARCH|nr:ABC transporter permease [Candidatus Nitrosarchaeum limnium]EPA05898.1 ABC-2 type transporter [Candidatus Nitrosarchaeum limnium BG20]